MISVTISGEVMTKKQFRTLQDGRKTIALSIGSLKSKGYDFFNVTFYDNNAINANNFVQQGSLISVTGNMVSRETTAPNGQKQTWWEVYADRFEMLQTRAEKSQHFNNQAYQNNNIDPVFRQNSERQFQQQNFQQQRPNYIQGYQQAPAQQQKAPKFDDGYEDDGLPF